MTEYKNTYMIAIFFIFFLGIMKCGANGASYTMCDTSPQVVEAGTEGGIISPQIQSAREFNCTLTLTGIPEYSWFELKVETFTLSCQYMYECVSGVSNCKTGNAYIKVDGSNTSICDSAPQNNTSVYLGRKTSLDVHFYSDYMRIADRFTITYRVVSVIDMGSSSQQVDARSKPSGYVASHSDYGQLDYGPQTNSRLTFTNVETVDIYFVDLNLEEYAKCYDYVIITGASSTKICQHQNASSFLQTWRSFNASSGFSVSIQFYSDNTGQYKGFLFQYKASTIATTPTTTNTATSTTTIISPTTVYTSTSTVDERSTNSSTNSQTTKLASTKTNEAGDPLTPRLKRLEAGLIVGISLLVVVVVVVVIAVVIFYLRRKKKSATNTQTNGSAGTDNKVFYVNSKPGTSSEYCTMESGGNLHFEDNSQRSSTEGATFDETEYYTIKEEDCCRDSEIRYETEVSNPGYDSVPHPSGFNIYDRLKSNRPVSDVYDSPVSNKPVSDDDKDIYSVPETVYENSEAMLKRTD